MSKATDASGNAEAGNAEEGGSDDEDVSEGEDDDIDEELAAELQQLTSGKDPKAKKQSFGLRSKKFWATKTAQTKMGRKAIGHFLGDEGNRIIKTLKDATTKDAGPKKAKELKLLIFKFAVKGMLLQSEGLIKKTHVWLLSEPLNSMAVKMYFALKPAHDDIAGTSAGGEDDDRASMPAIERKATSERKSLAPQSQSPGPADKKGADKDKKEGGKQGGTPGKDGKEGKEAEEKKGEDRRDVSAVVADIVAIRDMCSDVMNPHITDKNGAAMRGAFDYYGGAHFLNLLCNDPAYEEEKMICFNGMRKIVRPILEARRYDDDLQRICDLKDCEELAVAGDSHFCGSKYCLLHHEEEFQKLSKKPADQVNHFLVGDAKDYFPFQKCVKKGVERYIRKLYVTFLSYKTTKVGVRRVLADEIWKKYVDKKTATHYVPLPDELVKSIEPFLSSRADDLFDKAAEHCFERIDKYYKESFIKDPEFKEYMKLYTLPTYQKEYLKESKQQSKDKAKEAAKTKSG